MWIKWQNCGRWLVTAWKIEEVYMNIKTVVWTNIWTSESPCQIGTVKTYHLKNVRKQSLTLNHLKTSIVMWGQYWKDFQKGA